MKKIAFIILPALAALSCSLTGVRPDNTKPMYGGVEKKGKYKEADELFIEESIAEYGSRDSAARAYSEMAWLYWLDRKDSLTAVKRFNQAWLLDESLPDSYFGFGMISYARGDSEAGYHHFKDGYRHDTDGTRTAICLFRTADCFLAMGDTTNAMTAYRMLVKAEPGNIAARQKLGYYQMCAGLNEEARQTFGKAIGIDPANADNYIGRGYNYMIRREYREALADFDKAIELDPALSKAYTARSLLFTQTGEHDKALKDQRKAAELDSL